MALNTYLFGKKYKYFLIVNKVQRFQASTQAQLLKFNE